MLDQKSIFFAFFLQATDIKFFVLKRPQNEQTGHLFIAGLAGQIFQKIIRLKISSLMGCDLYLSDIVIEKLKFALKCSIIYFNKYFNETNYLKRVEIVPYALFRLAGTVFPQTSCADTV
jgi:hypothetical protein